MTQQFLNDLFKDTYDSGSDGIYLLFLIIAIA